MGPSALGGGTSPGSFAITDLDPAVNFDLALCGIPHGSTTITCVFVAQALEETNEGFDVKLPTAYDSLKLYLIEPSSGWTPCQVDGSGSLKEPYNFFIVTQ